MVFGLLIGGRCARDRRRNTAHAFEDSFSSPHLFMYGMDLFAAFTLVWITLRRELRAHDLDLRVLVP